MPKLDLTHTPENDAFDQQQSVTHITPLYRLRGRVVSGFGRGSKLLGCPTANLDPRAFEQIVVGAPRGVYAGWAQVGSDRSAPVYKCVLSLGTNPQFGTKQETVEAYILHDFGRDFYDEQLSLLICAFMRPSEKYSSIEELIRAISRDVRVGDRALDKEEFKQFQQDAFFRQEE